MMLKRARTTITGVTAAAMPAATSVAVVPAAQAASSGWSGEAPLVLVGHRDRDDDWRWKRNHRRHRDNDFPAALFGFGAGAILGSILAQPRYVAPSYAPSYHGDADAYCAATFKTYKQWTGTYTTYRGYEKPCP
jgi:hypothetical protein